MTTAALLIGLVVVLATIAATWLGARLAERFDKWGGCVSETIHEKFWRYVARLMLASGFNGLHRRAQWRWIAAYRKRLGLPAL